MSKADVHYTGRGEDLFGNEHQHVFTTPFRQGTLMCSAHDFMCAALIREDGNPVTPEQREAIHQEIKSEYSRVPDESWRDTECRCSPSYDCNFHGEDI